MRSNTNIQPGQLWQNSDTRRLRLLEVAAVGVPEGKGEQRVGEPMVYTLQLYPPKLRPLVLIPRRTFMTTGSKGLTRVR